MRLPFGRGSIRRSKYNGLIRTNAQDEVLAFGIRQTSTRYADIWEDAFAHAAPLIKSPVKNVLMLGLAGGGALPAIYKTYRGCKVTAVEHDLAMVKIAKELVAWKPYPAPAIIVDDATQALLHLGDKFDLILVDIFTGSLPAEAVSTDKFWKLINARLLPGGTSILNVGVNSTALYRAQSRFAKHSTWQYGALTLCALSA